MSGTSRNNWNANVIEEFRENEGEVGGPFEGRPMLILHHTGAKTGKERETPLVYQEVDGQYAIFASKGGAPTNPDWFHNIVANPEVKVEIGTDTIEATARVLDSDEREPIWTRQKELMPGFAEYEKKTDREIPAIVLEPAS